MYPNSKADDIDISFPGTLLGRMLLFTWLQCSHVIDDCYAIVLFASYFSIISLLSKLFLNMTHIDFASKRDQQGIDHTVKSSPLTPHFPPLTLVSINIASKLS